MLITHSTPTAQQAGLSAREALVAVVACALDCGMTHREVRRLVDKEFYRQVIERAAGNKCKAAQLAGEHRNTMSRNLGAL